jgi:dihydrofolate reductase
MRKLIESSFVSLDGVVGDAETWAMSYFAEAENKQHGLARLLGCDAFLLGRQTFALLTANGRRSDGDPYDDHVSSLPKYVASTTLRPGTIEGTVIGADVVAEVTALKQQPGKDIMKYGNGALTRALVEHDLIDEFVFWIIPVVVGSGRRLFEGIDMRHLQLELTGTTRFGNGAVTLSYVPIDVRVPV